MGSDKLEIILIEDDEDDYYLTRDILEEIGPEIFRLQWISTYEKARESLLKLDPDIFLMDYRLGAHDGLDLLKLAVSSNVSAPIIMLTGQGNREIDQLALRSGAADYLIKGEINPNLLERAIRHAIERRQFAEEIRARETKFRSLIESSYDAILLLDREFRFTYLSPGFTRILGHSVEDWLGKFSMDLVHEEDAAELGGQLDSLLHSGSHILQAQFRARHADGSWRWIEVDYANQLDRQHVGAFVVNFRDVTERWLHERKLATIAHLSSVVRSATSRPELVKDALQDILEASGSDAAVVASYNIEHEAFAIEPGVGSWSPDSGNHLHLPDEELSRSVFESRSPFMDTVVDGGVQAALAGIPVISSESRQGVLWLKRTKPYTIDEVNMVGSLADIISTALHRMELFEQTQRRLGNLKALRKIDVSISNSFDISVSLDVVLEQAQRQLGVDAAAVFLLEKADGKLHHAASIGLERASWKNVIHSPGVGVSGHALETPNYVVVAPVDWVAPGNTGLVFEAEGFVVHGVATMQSKGLAIGTLEIYHRSPLAPNQEWLEFFETLAGQAAIAVENINLFLGIQRKNSELSAAYDATIEGWSRALDLRDKETEGHSQRVTELTVQLAIEVGMNSDQIRDVRRGALLHDMGKLAVPDSILLKPDKLTDEEWVIMKQHPVFAYQMLSPIPYLQSALDIPHCHHEKWDGTGYPRGLKGEEIPLSARIFAIVDVWDALRSDRPYRKAWPVEKVLDYIESMSGTHFDPDMVKLFMSVMRESQL